MNGPRAIVVVDLAYGDCGKGTVVDFLTRHCGAATVVRFNGGPQAGHNVVTPDGRHHTFAQFGSGTFVPGVRTLLSRFMFIEPYAMLAEAAHLAELGVHDAFGRLLVDADCPVITPAHQCANRLREMHRGAAAHGTCGLGVGETMADLLDQPRLILRAGELGDGPLVRRKLLAWCGQKAEALAHIIQDLRDHPRATQSIEAITRPTWLDAAAANYAEVAARATVVDSAAVLSAIFGGPTVFEGAQGVLLDESFGFHPHTTWSTTTFDNALTLLGEAGFDGGVFRLGVLRSYFTRHGPGPFVSEDVSLRPLLPEPHNADAGWQGGFRVGAFDAVAARYALAVAVPVDGVALTHLDRLPDLPGRACTAYRFQAGDPVPAHVDSMFVKRGARVLDIRAPSCGDLRHLACLTEALGRCRPEYVPMPAGADAFAAAVERELGARVSVTSAGPTWRDKSIRGSGLRA